MHDVGGSKQISPAAVAAVDRCALFRHMSRAERAHVAAHTVWRIYQRGEQVVRAQEPGEDVYIVAAGTLLANQFSRAGREIGYRRLEVGAHFGELAAIDGAPRSANVFALTVAEIGRLPQTLVKTLLSDCPGFTQALLEDLTAMVRSLSAQVFRLGAIPAPCRLQMELLRMARASGVAQDRARIIGIPTHAEMAVLVGTQREVVSREFARLSALGLIARTGKDVVIAAVSALAAEIERQGGDASLSE